MLWFSVTSMYLSEQIHLKGRLSFGPPHTYTVVLHWQLNVLSTFNKRNITVTHIGGPKESLPYLKQHWVLILILIYLTKEKMLAKWEGLLLFLDFDNV